MLAAVAVIKTRKRKLPKLTERNQKRGINLAAPPPTSDPTVTMASTKTEKSSTMLPQPLPKSPSLSLE